MITVSDWLEWAGILAAGFGAGMINVIVGSGTLISFPVLLLFGYPPVLANVTNTVGLVPGSLSGTIGYRRELWANRRLARLLLPASTAGGIAGASLLFVLPARAFGLIVPVLIAAGIVMVLLGPLVQRRAARGAKRAPAGSSRWKTIGIVAGVFLLGIYGGYFGAAQGILIVGLLSLLTSETIQSLNGVKNLLVMAVNLIAAITFVVIAPTSIDWFLVALIAIGSALGGLVGAGIGRRLPPSVLRGTIAVIGTAAIVYLLVT